VILFDFWLQKTEDATKCIEINRY